MFWGQEIKGLESPITCRHIGDLDPIQRVRVDAEDRSIGLFKACGVVNSIANQLESGVFGISVHCRLMLGTEIAIWLRVSYEVSDRATQSECSPIRSSEGTYRGWHIENLLYVGC